MGSLLSPKKQPKRGDVRSAALLVALFTIVVGRAGLVSPDSVTAVRRPLVRKDSARVGAAVALAAGGFLAFAVTSHRRKSGAK